MLALEAGAEPCGSFSSLHCIFLCERISGNPPPVIPVGCVPAALHKLVCLSLRGPYSLQRHVAVNICGNANGRGRSIF